MKNIAILMSGSGTNARKIIEYERECKKKGLYPYQVRVIFSNVWDSQASKIGRDFNIPVVIRDAKAYYEYFKIPLKDMAVRQIFDQDIKEVVECFGCTIIAYAGYNMLASPVLVHSFTGINVHPADLSIMDGGKRKYTGSHAVRDAILAGESYIASTTHLVNNEVDGGRILMISNPVEVILPQHFDTTNSALLKKVVEYNQNRLKEFGDWVIFPKTLEMLSE